MYVYSILENSRTEILKYSMNVNNGGAVSGLRPLACWDCGFESHRRHGYLSRVSVFFFCQLVVSASFGSLVQGNPIDCGVFSESDREAI